MVMGNFLSGFTRRALNDGSCYLQREVLEKEGW